MNTTFLIIAIITQVLSVASTIFLVATDSESSLMSGVVALVLGGAIFSWFMAFKKEKEPETPST